MKYQLVFDKVGVMQVTNENTEFALSTSGDPIALSLRRNDTPQVSIDLRESSRATLSEINALANRDSVRDSFVTDSEWKQVSVLLERPKYFRRERQTT